MPSPGKQGYRPSASQRGHEGKWGPAPPAVPRLGSAFLNQADVLTAFIVSPAETMFS